MFHFTSSGPTRAVIAPIQQLSSFQNGFSGGEAAVFQNAIGSQPVTLEPGNYFVGVRTSNNSVVRFSLELDDFIKTGPTESSLFQEDVTFDSLLLEPGAIGWIPFRITNGSGFTADGVNTGLLTYVIPGSELTNFQNRTSFSSFSAYKETGLGAPGQKTLNLAEGLYYYAFYNNSASDQAVNVRVSRWNEPSGTGGTGGSISLTGTSFELRDSSVRIVADRISNTTSFETGRLRIALWASDQPFDGGILGYRLGVFELPSSLPANSVFDNVDVIVERFEPPAGTYWMSIVLSEFVNGDWVTVDGRTFPDRITFSDPITPSVPGIENLSVLWLLGEPGEVVNRENHLQWEDLGDGYYYQVWRSSSNNFNTAQVQLDASDAYGLPFHFDTVDWRDRYYYWVAGIDVATGTVGEPTMIEAPSQVSNATLPSIKNLRATRSELGESISLSWDSAGSDYGYVVYRQQGDVQEFLELARVTGLYGHEVETTWTGNGLDPNLPYTLHVTVRSLRNGEIGPPSRVLVPAVVTNVEPPRFRPSSNPIELVYYSGESIGFGVALIQGEDSALTYSLRGAPSELSIAGNGFVRGAIERLFGELSLEFVIRVENAAGHDEIDIKMTIKEKSINSALNASKNRMTVVSGASDWIPTIVPGSESLVASLAIPAGSDQSSNPLLLEITGPKTLYFDWGVDDIGGNILTTGSGGQGRLVLETSFGLSQSISATDGFMSQKLVVPFGPHRLRFEYRTQGRKNRSASVANFRQAEHQNLTPVYLQPTKRTFLVDQPVVIDLKTFGAESYEIPDYLREYVDDDLIFRRTFSDGDFDSLFQAYGLNWTATNKHGSTPFNVFIGFRSETTRVFSDSLGPFGGYLQAITPLGKWVAGNSNGRVLRTVTGASSTVNSNAMICEFTLPGPGTFSLDAEMRGSSSSGRLTVALEGDLREGALDALPANQKTTKIIQLRPGMNSILVSYQQFNENDFLNGQIWAQISNFKVEGFSAYLISQNRSGALSDSLLQYLHPLSDLDGDGLNTYLEYMTGGGIFTRRENPLSLSVDLAQEEIVLEYPELLALENDESCRLVVEEFLTFSDNTWREVELDWGQRRISMSRRYQRVRGYQDVGDNHGFFRLRAETNDVSFPRQNVEAPRQGR